MPLFRVHAIADHPHRGICLQPVHLMTYIVYDSSAYNAYTWSIITSYGAIMLPIDLRAAAVGSWYLSND